MKGYYKGKEVAICINQKEGRWLNIPITADGIVTSVTAKYITVEVEKGLYKGTYKFINEPKMVLRCNRHSWNIELFTDWQAVEDYDNIKKIKQAVKDKIDNAEFTPEKWRMIKEIFDITI